MDQHSSPGIKGFFLSLSDFTALYAGTEKDERNLLSSLSSGDKFRELQTILNHTILSTRSGFSTPDFRTDRPFVLLILNPEVGRFLRVRESICNLSSADGLRIPPAVLNLKPREEERE